MKIRSLVALLFSILIVTSSVSCATRTLVASTNTPEPTQEATPSATPMATPSPEPTATPVVSLSPEEHTALLNQQFTDFLNKEGEYTVEKIEEYCPIWGSRFCYEDGNGTNLGILRIFNERSDENDIYVSVYGYLYDVTRNEDNNIVLTMGFDGKNDNRFNTDLMILSSSYDYIKSETDNTSRCVFSFSTEEGLHLDDKCVTQFEATSSDQIFDHLNGLRGKKIVADIPAQKINLNEISNTGSKIFWEESNKRLPYTYNLINRLANNGIDTSVIGSSGKDIILIDSNDDLEAIDFDSVPIIIGIRYRENG